jgi:hypothetical protein
MVNGEEGDVLDGATVYWPVFIYSYLSATF